MMNLKSPPLVSVVRSYIEECREANSGLRESTVDQYQRVLMAFAGDARGKLPLVAVTQATIERYREGRSVKPGTWRKELQILRTFFKWATNTKEWLDR